MATSIKDDRHLGEDVYLLENEYLKVRVLKRFGAKVASIYHKPMGFEFLHQPTKNLYDKPLYVEKDGKPGIDFSHYDTSGLDECFPTIDACTYATEKNTYFLPDHGELWYSEANQSIEAYELPKGVGRELEEEEEQYALVSSFTTKSMPFSFKRALVLQEANLILDYEVENLGEEPLPFLWALHGLATLDRDMELVLPEGSLQNVMNENYDFDAFDKLLLEEYPKNAMVKFYLEHPVDAGKASLLYPRQNLRVNYKWKAKDLPYLGVWVTTGGFKKEKNLALEPCTGFYDSVERAVEEEKISVLKPKEKKKWSVVLEFLPLRSF